MGATTFFTSVKSKSAEEAFQAAKTESRFNFGHAGYTGTIAEKPSFVVIPLPTGVDPEDYASKLIDKRDMRIDNKWGPAGCFEMTGNEKYFFGWASC